MCFKSRNVFSVFIAGTTLAFAISPALAQNPSGDPAGKSVTIEEVVVTARRRAESLQDVPQTINAVSGEAIDDLNITDTADLDQLVPGISIQADVDAAGGGSSMRGVPTFLQSNATPVVQFYLNDAPSGRGPDVMSSLFDIGQIEVLKGPQGTLRGRSAPMGAITATTRQPDLYEIGGYVNVSDTNREHMNVQGAIGLPLIEDVLALRLAGVWDEDTVNGVESVNSSRDPESTSEAVRATLRFEPTGDFAASFMAQHQRIERTNFLHIAGPGNGLNGPPIKADDRLGITDAAAEGDITHDFFVLQADWSFAGQALSYVGSYRDSEPEFFSPQDRANVVPGGAYFQHTTQPSEEKSHELRLSSNERIAGLFDYTVGAFYDLETSASVVTQVAAFLPGAFGNPGALPVPSDPHPRYTIPLIIDIDPEAEEISYFANVTAHVSDRTVISAGGRLITFKRDDNFTIDTGSAFAGVAAPCSFVPAPGAVPSPVYPGGCDVPVPSRVIQELHDKETYDDFIYNLSVSHDLTPDFMVYANTGTAFRSAGPTIGISGVTECCLPPSNVDLAPFTDLIFHEPENSTMYEMGFKSNFLDGRGRLNLAVFRQTFENFVYLTPSTRYLSVTDPTNPAAGDVGSYQFTASADAVVTGIDGHVGFQVTPRWDISAGFTWAEAELDDASIPCNDGNFDGAPDTIMPTVQDFINAGVMITRCRSNESINRTPEWNLTLQSAYSAPISSNIDAFIRGYGVFYPDNPNASEVFEADSHGLLNLFAGIRSADGAWEVAVFAENVTGTSETLSRNSVAVTSSGQPGNFFPAPGSGYYEVTHTPRREIGLSVRYAFGSR